MLTFAAVLSISALTLTATVSHAQEQGQQRRPGAGQRRAGGGQRGGAGGVMAIQQALQAVGLTDEQKGKIEPLVAKFREETRAIGSDVTPEQRREKVQALNQKFLSDVEAVLTPEQKTKFQAELQKARQNAGNPAARIPQQLNLTEEQKTKAEPILKEFGDAWTKLQQDRTVERAARTEKTQALVADLKTKLRPILTPEQQKQLEEIRFGGGRGPGGAGRGQGGGARPATAI
ncbi:MAG TPA: hypothetical protein VM490_01415 [Armatimonadaceae bacterium]|jgi:Spy/CpxP family protein refolding chaperone|nr:hypothetical protein [Armatimonadaceae bacterium]